MVGYNMNGSGRDRVLKMMEEKERIESDIRDQTAILETNNVSMHDSLVDSEGFPRNDIDVYRVRHARHRIICLQNDHKDLMKMIEKGIAEVHADLLSIGGSQSVVSPATYRNGHMSSSSNGGSVNGRVNNQCFATVGFVTDGSPAEAAGLCEHDEILQFGSVNHHNFRDMSQIMDIVGHSVGQRINVKVRRGHNILNVTLIPRPWQQPGLLGCQIFRKS